MTVFPPSTHELGQCETPVTCRLFCCHELRERSKKVGLVTLGRIEEEGNGDPGILCGFDYYPVLNALHFIIGNHLLAGTTFNHCCHK